MSEDNTAQNELELTRQLGQRFDQFLEAAYGSYTPPEPYVTPTGIAHLDGLLGGGIISSGPVMISSTPETGKSTFAFQMGKAFQDTHTTALVVYVDIEGSANKESTECRVNRIDSFNLDKSRIKYMPVVLDVMEFWKLIQSLVDFKKGVESKGHHITLLVVWDSIAATPSSKASEAEDPNKTIGTKARQLSFCLDKYVPLLKFHQITLIAIDQVRADLKIDPYAQNEKTVGSFKNLKSATNIFALDYSATIQ